MKTLKTSLILLTSILIYACTTGEVGPQGPAGPEGPEGIQGESAYVFEYSDVDFISPDYEVILPYPDDFEGVASDVALVYLLWDVSTDGDGNQLEVWRQMPQIVHTELGKIHYNFDFTIPDVRLFLIPEFSPTELLPVDTDDWVIRTVIIPGDFWGSRMSLDHSDYNAVKEAYGLPEFNSHEIKKRRD